MRTFTLLLALVLLVAALTVKCPIHPNSNPVFTGRTEFIDGAFLQEYRCLGYGQAHTFWVRVN